VEFLLSLLLLVAAVAVIVAPLRRSRHAGRAVGPELAALQAAKEAKLREIHDAELDFRTGKLSARDYQALDHALRAEAIELVRRLDAAGEAATQEPPRA
jgi:type II secretory pathway component PulM